MIINYNPTEISNKAKFFNENIEKNINEKYIMFIFNDIYEHVKNIDQFYSEYENLLKRFNIPFACYPYYIHFNKVLKSSLSFHNPKMQIYINKNHSCDIINQLAYGMIIFDIEKMKNNNFKFDESYQTCFYLQEYANFCHSKGMMLSSNYFIDVPNSFNLVDSSLKEGYFIDAKQFMEEKTRFYSKNENLNENLNDYIKNLKSLCEKIKLKEAMDSKVILVDNKELKNVIK